MDRKQLKDILAIHADQLARGQHPRTEDYRDLSAADRDELAPLFDVAEQIRSTLQPITPPPGFETNLKQELLTTAHLRQAEGYRPPDPSRDLIILAGIMGFFIALAGALLALRIRRQRGQFVSFPQS